MKMRKSTEMLEGEDRRLEGMDRLQFHRRILSDLRRELDGLEDVERILEAVLLTAMGSLGVVSGFSLLVDKESGKHWLVHRGLGRRETEALQTHVPEVIRRYFSKNSGGEDRFFTDSEVITREGLTDAPFCPQVRVLIKWTINDVRVGLMGLGARILFDVYGDGDIEFLLGLTDNLMFSIQKTRSASLLRQLQWELREKDGLLEEALKRSEHTREELDRRLFHLKSFHDITRELAGLRDTGRILETFLLMVLGIFSVGQGYVLMLDREKKSVLISSRGIEKEELSHLPEAELERVLVKYLEAAKPPSLLPSNARVITGGNLLGQLPGSRTVRIAAVFFAEESCQGLVGLGEKITQQPFSEQDSQLLATLVSNLSVFLRNTRSFETIQALNLHLEKRNEELEKAVEDLKASRSKIEILERAKSRIKTSLQKERQRARRVSLVDVALILGVAFLLGLIYNFSSPGRINLIPQSWMREPPPLIESHLAKLKHEDGNAIFVDARPAEFFGRGHIQGAVNLPYTLFDFVYAMKLAKVDPQRELIVYGRNISRRYDEEVGYKLISKGHRKVKILSGGLSVWRKNGFPMGPQRK